jgi:hypothetical protein
VAWSTVTNTQKFRWPEMVDIKFSREGVQQGDACIGLKLALKTRFYVRGMFEGGFKMNFGGKRAT